MVVPYLLAVNHTGHVKGHFSLHLVEGSLELDSIHGAGTIVSLEQTEYVNLRAYHGHIDTYHGLIVDLGDLEGRECGTGDSTPELLNDGLSSENAHGGNSSSNGLTREGGRCTGGSLGDEHGERLERGQRVALKNGSRESG
jgi:hypothetical protein